MLVLIISALIIKERITKRKVIGILIGAAGAIILIAYGKQVRFTSNQILGDILILVNAISFGIYLVLVKTLMNKYHPLTVVKWVFTFGIFFVLPFSISDFKPPPGANFPGRFGGLLPMF